MAKETLVKKAVHAGGWQIARRIARSIPYGGGLIAIALVGSDIKRKGFTRGVVNSGLDAIPFVGFGKNVIEFFTGDLLPDKAVREEKKR